jgi:hypothetical protein
MKGIKSLEREVEIEINSGLNIIVGEMLLENNNYDQ